jgi:hypothetical protein
MAPIHLLITLYMSFDIFAITNQRDAADGIYKFFLNPKFATRQNHQVAIYIAKNNL